jgi:hypothetical protein
MLVTKLPKGSIVERGRGGRFTGRGMVFAFQRVEMRLWHAADPMDNDRDG